MEKIMTSRRKFLKSIPFIGLLLVTEAKADYGGNCPNCKHSYYRKIEVSSAGFAFRNVELKACSKCGNIYI